MTQATMELTQQLIDRWTAHGISCPPGMTPRQIADFERRYGVRLPMEFRSYLLTVNGMGERGTCDDDFFSFWSLADVITIAEEFPDRCSGFPDASHYFMFADHSIWLPTFAIRLSSDPADSNPVASVFSDFGAFAVEDKFDSSPIS